MPNAKSSMNNAQVSNLNIESDDDANVNINDEEISNTSSDIGEESDTSSVIGEESDVSVASYGSNAPSNVSKDRDENTSDPEGNSAWASVMGQVLCVGKKRKTNKTIVLSKAKKLVLNKDVTKAKTEDEASEEIKRGEKIAHTKKCWASQCRVKPSVLEKDQEKALQKVAVRGVVQLFNAVKNHQQVEEKNPKEVRSSIKNPKRLGSLNKDSFFKLLMSDNKTLDVKSETKIEIKKDEDVGKSNWNVLREDFMIDSKLKDWDTLADNSSVTVI